MLRKEDFIHFGKFLKPHGTKGEITLESDSIALGEDCDFVACEVDGILSSPTAAPTFQKGGPKRRIYSLGDTSKESGPPTALLARLARLSMLTKAP